MMARHKRKNPYLASYVGLALICCIFFFAVFFFINYKSLSKEQEKTNQKKVELLTNDLDVQLQLLEDTALKISINTKYQPIYFHGSKYNEKILLDDFMQYNEYSVLVQECFLYYESEENIFHSSGYVKVKDIYFSEFGGEVAQLLQEGILAAMNHDTMQFCTDQKRLFVLVPFKTRNEAGWMDTVMGYVIRLDKLKERFNIVSGEIKGTLCLYQEEDFLFCNGEIACTENQKRVLSDEILSRDIKVCYLPDKESFLMGGYLSMMFILVLVDVLLVLVVANLYAHRSYKTILEMVNKYRKKGDFAQEADCENALEEIDNMLESMIKNNVLANIQIEQKQKMLRKQVLHLLLSDNYSFHVETYLDKLQIKLPGPYYFVVCASFEQEAVDEGFLTGLQDELDNISLDNELSYVYCVCDFEKKSFSVICSVSQSLQKQELTELIQEVSASYSVQPIVGVGNTYESLHRLRASWMESLEIVNRQQRLMRNATEQVTVFDTNSLKRMGMALREGVEESAVSAFEEYLEQQEKQMSSILFQHYVCQSFLFELSSIAGEQKITIPDHSISLMLSAKNVVEFKEAALDLIHALCMEIHAMRHTKEQDDTYRILNYVNEHFAEYELSIAGVAGALNVSEAAVRQAIFRHTGKMYKDYLIYLRIEYAKKLLLQNELTVAETCQAVGYGNISYFIKLFREMTGVTPAKYKTVNVSMKGVFNESGVD